MVVLELESKSQFSQLMQQYKLVIVDSWGSWCSPCKYLEPLYEELSNEYANSSDIIFTKADAEKRLFDIAGLPCIRFYANGKQIEEVLGADIKKIRSVLEGLVGTGTPTGNRPPTGNRHPARSAVSQPSSGGAPQPKKRESNYKSYGDMMK
jgi:thioredoxin 1